MKVFIYILKHPETDEVRYVGLTRYPQKRLSNEISAPHTVHFRNWIEKLKRDNLRPKMVIVEETDEEHASEYERIWISLYREQHARLLNFTTGGESGFAMSDETKKKILVAVTGRKYGPMSKEHKAKISAANKGKCYNPHASEQFIRLNRSRAGKPLSEETKRKLSEIGKANFIKGEWKEKISAVNRSRAYKSKMTDEQKSEIKFLIQDGYSVKVVAEAYGISLGTVSYVRRNRIWKNIAPAVIPFTKPPYKTVPLFRNVKGQYERAA